MNSVTKRKRVNCPEPGRLRGVMRRRAEARGRDQNAARVPRRGHLLRKTLDRARVGTPFIPRGQFDQRALRVRPARPLDLAKHDASLRHRQRLRTCLPSPTSQNASAAPPGPPRPRRRPQARSRAVLRSHRRPRMRESNPVVVPTAGNSAMGRATPSALRCAVARPPCVGVEGLRKSPRPRSIGLAWRFAGIPVPRASDGLK